ncbi:MAG: DUF3179 domain-containing protein [Calditrichaeota bacterium]|nr:MAG: DUF3179 domain-containing protein [Calditrichota bacterium]
MRSMKAVLFFGLIPLFIMACNSVTEPGSGTTQPVDIIEEDEKIFITDLTGKKWDITHAVNEYGFIPNQFSYGLGPFAIQPINNPEFAQSGDSNFPSPQSPTLIMGTELSGDSRAYAIGIMSRFEVANDKFGTLNVAVAY